MLDRIRAASAALPPAERRVAQLLLGDPRSFATLPIASLAQRAGVSKPTIVRFCRSVGYDGLTDFKLKLAGHLDEGVPYVHRAVTEHDRPEDLVRKLVDNSVAALLRYRQAAAPQAIERAIEALEAACRDGRRVAFYGVGAAGIVARDAQQKFLRLGAHAEAVSDGHMQVMSATLMGAGDCAVVISISGRSRDLLDVAELAQRQAATVIALTASGSPLAHLALARGGVLLAADHPEDVDRHCPMVSRLLHLLIVDVLTTGVALRLGSTALRPLLQEIQRNLRQRRYVADEGDGRPSPADGAGPGDATSAPGINASTP